MSIRHIWKFPESRGDHKFFLPHPVSFTKLFEIKKFSSSAKHKIVLFVIAGTTVVSIVGFENQLLF